MHEAGVGRIRCLLMFLKVVVHFQIREGSFYQFLCRRFINYVGGLLKIKFNTFIEINFLILYMRKI
jgi:hypothetical protein